MAKDFLGRPVVAAFVFDSTERTPPLCPVGPQCEGVVVQRNRFVQMAGTASFGRSFRERIEAGLHRSGLPVRAREDQQRRTQQAENHPRNCLTHHESVAAVHADDVSGHSRRHRARAYQTRGKPVASTAKSCTDRFVHGKPLIQCSAFVR